MGMYKKEVQREETRRKGPHPVWRGIGCVLIVLIVVMSFAGSSLLVDANRDNNWVDVPEEIQGSLPVIRIMDEPVLYVELIMAFILAVVGFGIFVLFYSFIFRASRQS